MTTALLMIDPYNDFLSEGGKLWPMVREMAEHLELVPNLRRLLDAARAAGLTIVFVPHRQWEEGDLDGWRVLTPTHVAARRLHPFVRGSWGAQFHPELQPRQGELVVGEHWLHSGFANTDLDLQLRNRGVDHLILVGMRGNTCLEATARWAAELGYRTTLVKDATATFTPGEWAATMEVNARAFAHAVVTTRELLASPAMAAQAEGRV